MSNVKVKDFGRKIGGARKDVWHLRGLLLGDLEEMNSEEKKKYVTKSNVWPFPGKAKLQDYIQKKDGDRFSVYFENMVRTNMVRPYSSSSRYCPHLAAETYVENVSMLKDYIQNLPPYWWTDAEGREAVENQLNLFYLEDGGYGYVFKNSLLRIFGKEGKNMKMFYTYMQMEGFGLEGEERARVMINSCYTFYTIGEDGVDLIDDTHFRVKDADLNWGSRHEVKEPLQNGMTVAVHTSATRTRVSRFYLAEVVSGNREDFLDKKVQEFIQKEEDEKKKKEKKKAKAKKRWKAQELAFVRRKGPRIIGNPDDKGIESFFINVAEDDWQNAYAFYGVEFGNWTNQDYRQIAMNMAFEAMDDLGHAMGISRRDLNLTYQDDQCLSLAFGARGHSKAMAHYEHARNVINLTKKRGAGCLAHEYGHAFDHFLGKFVGEEYASESITMDLCKEVQELMRLICYYSPNYIKGSEMFDATFCKVGNGYWASHCEMFARAFESFILDKLSDLGIVDDYLVYQNKENYKIKKENGTYYSIPLAEERRKINKAFDKAIKALIEQGVFSPYKPFDLKFFGPRVPLIYREVEEETKPQRIVASNTARICNAMPTHHEPVRINGIRCEQMKFF